MSRETILVSDAAALRATFSCLSPFEVGAAMMLAFHIAENGPVDGKDIRRTVGLRGRQRFPDQEWLRRLFSIEGGVWDLNPDTFNLRYRGSDALRAGISAGVREAIHERDGYRCTYCGTGDGPFEIDHIHPVSRGGSNDLDNLCLACSPCNRSKSNKTLAEWEGAR